MARVVLVGNLAQLTGGVAEFQLSATSVKQLFQQLTELHPAIGRHLDDGVAVAIDGQIYQDALLQPIAPDSEVFLLPQIAGGRDLADSLGRREFLTTVLGAAVVPVVSTAGSALAQAKNRTGESPMRTTYDPAASFELKVSEVEFRRAVSGRMLMARIYQPQGAGPFPTLLDLHGGAWNNKDRFANEPMDRAVAASGVLAVAIDLTLAPEAPYPASVQDANYGVRWLKSRAGEWNGEAATLGVLGSSSGGHVAQLLALRPRDANYNAIPLPSAPSVDATVAYVATRSPISDTYARYQQAEKMKREGMIKNNKIYFRPWATIFEGNPQQILDRREALTLPPLLIMQGELDDNVLPAVQEKFAASYRAAGGQCELHVFEGCEHEWVAKPGPQTDRAHQMVREFIARSLKAGAARSTP
jgi:acetyl esterase